MCVFLLVSRTWVFIIAAEKVSRISASLNEAGFRHRCVKEGGSGGIPEDSASKCLRAVVLTVVARRWYYPAHVTNQRKNMDGWEVCGLG